jgi:Flp pilus assembly protein TadG
VIRHFTQFWRRRDGVSAIEFALVAPIILLLLAATVDFGSMIHARTQMEGASQSAMTYAMGRGQPFEATKAPELAQNLERILLARLGQGSTIAIDVNHGAQRSLANGSASATGNAALSALCYCPTMSETGVSWNTALACAKPCPKGGTSGKFVYMSVMVAASPIFGGFGLADNGQLQLQTIGRIE